MVITQIPLYTCDLIYDGTGEEIRDDCTDAQRAEWLAELVVESAGRRHKNKLYQLHVYPVGESGGEFAGSTRIYTIVNGTCEMKVV